MHTIQSQEKLDRDWELALLSTAAILTVTIVSTLIMVYTIFVL